MSTNLPLAITLNIIGSLISAIGWVLEKKQHQIQEQKETDNQNADLDLTQQTPKLKKQPVSDISSIELKSIFVEANDESQELKESNETNLSYCKSYVWWLGFIVFGAGSALTAVSLPFGPASLLVPLESIIIIFNMILGCKFLNEQMHIKDYIGTFLIIIGITAITLVGPQKNDISYSIEDLRILFHNQQFYIFIIFYTLLVLLCYILLKIRLQNLNKDIKNDTMCMLGFVTIASYYGVWNTSLTKKCMEIVSDSFNGRISNWSHPLTYVFIICFILSTILLEYWRQKALALYVSTYVVATYRVLWIFGGVLFGAFYWKEFDDVKDWEIAIFVLGLLVMFAGICFIAKQQNVKSVCSSIQAKETEEIDELPNINNN